MRNRLRTSLSVSPASISSVIWGMSKAAPFGTVLGYSPGGVPCYSSHYPSIPCVWWCCCCCFWPFHKVAGQAMGIKWQCVEFARRWLMLQRGYVFESVPCAYNIFDLTHVVTVPAKKRLRMTGQPNGSTVHPKMGSMLIWKAEGKFSGTGHVAIICGVSATGVRIAEQNYDDLVWPTAEQDYARELPAEVGPKNDYWIRSPAILGWMIVDEEDSLEAKGEGPLLLSESKTG